MTDGQNLAALKLYQRTPNQPGSFDTKAITDELAILNLLDATPAREHVPQILAHDAAVQYILLTPVGERLTSLHVDGDLIVGLVTAVQALHTYCIHRDLRAANILVVPGVPCRIKIIDWNLGLAVTDLARPHKPEGATCVQGFAVLTAMRSGTQHRYKLRDDLQSLVRAMFLVMCPGTTAPKQVRWSASYFARYLRLLIVQGASEFSDWGAFWRNRLQQRDPPVGAMDSVWYWWMVAEERASAEDYGGLRDALLRVV